MAGLAEKMFWRSPELVDNLINFLDVESVAELAKANPFTAELLESSKKTWGELVQRSCPFLDSQLPSLISLFLFDRYHSEPSPKNN